MESLFPVYSLMPIELVRGQQSTVWDSEGTPYTDFYGGHAVISIGHAHPSWVNAITSAASTLGYYSNSVHIPIQEDASAALLRVSQRDNYRVFFVNSGAEANENAMKVASFVTNRKRVIAFEGAFHGRTSLAVATTHNPSISAPVNSVHDVTFLPLNDEGALQEELEREDVAAVIIEGIQGVGGCKKPTPEFLITLEEMCTKHGTLLILDEIQSGCGRTGRYFAFDTAGVNPPLITMAKGIGNGFPIGAVMIRSDITLPVGSLGTTFGGNHMASAAVKSVVEVLENEHAMQNALERGAFLSEEFRKIPSIKEVRGDGLMIGLKLEQSVGELRTNLRVQHHVLTGSASDPTVVRLLPPLCITQEECEHLVRAIKSEVG